MNVLPKENRNIAFRLVVDVYYMLLRWGGDSGCGLDSPAGIWPLPDVVRYKCPGCLV